MDDTAVSASLVLPNIPLLFQDEDPCLGIPFPDCHSSGQSDDSSSNDYILMHGWNSGTLFCRRTIPSLIHHSEDYFPATKSLSVTGGRSGLSSPEPHQTVKQLLREPLLIVLRFKVPDQGLYFLARVNLAQRH